jgi:hypothetical protein
MAGFSDDDRFSPRFAAIAAAAIGGLWAWVAVTRGLGGDLPVEERRNVVMMHTVLGGITVALVLAFCWRMVELRRRGDLTLHVPTNMWRRGQAVSGSVELPFEDPVTETSVRLVRMHKGNRSEIGEPFSSSVARQRDGTQMLLFRGAVAQEARAVGLFLEVRVGTMGGLSIRSSFRIELID